MIKYLHKTDNFGLSKVDTTQKIDDDELMKYLKSIRERRARKRRLEKILKTLDIE